LNRATPSFEGLLAASAKASRIASANSAKRDTKPELLLRRALRHSGVRYEVDACSLPGRPDLVFSAARLVVFCDGDFWHGRNLRARLRKLRAGHNSSYWVSKIATNVARDRKVEKLLRDLGWTVMRFWESDIRANPYRAANAVLRVLVKMGRRPGLRRGPKPRRLDY
jgi:DNA mismatch endonuclease (patch repair protein)